MMKPKWIRIAVLAIGIASGPSALVFAKAAQPPIDWRTIPFVFVGGIIGSVFTIGIQILRRDPKYARSALGILTVISIFVLGSGLGALISGAISKEFGPASLLFVAIGMGLTIGIFFAGVAYRAKFKK